MMTKKNNIPTVLIHVAKWEFARRLLRPLTIAPQVQLIACRTPAEFLLECQKSPAGVIVDTETLRALLPDLQKLPTPVSVIVAVFSPHRSPQDFERCCGRKKNVTVVDWCRVTAVDRISFSEALWSFTDDRHSVANAKAYVRSLPKELRRPFRETVRGKREHSPARMREFKHWLRVQSDCRVYRIGRMANRRMK